MRVAALTLLIVSSPTPSRLISLYWYMQSEPSQHLYNYFYTILKSMERTTHPCYIHMYIKSFIILFFIIKFSNIFFLCNFMILEA